MKVILYLLVLMRLETYLRQHTEAEFTHGMCPECYEKLKNDIEKTKDY